MSGVDARSRLLQRLRTEAWRKGTFTLASGKTSDFFVDCKPVALSAEGHCLVGEVFCSVLEGSGVELVAGVALGGCALASAVAVESYRRGHGWDALFVRKEPKDHGTRRLVEGPAAAGRRVFLLEDVLTTGGSSRAAVLALRDAGLRCDDVLALVDRREGAVDALARDGIRAQSLFTREDIVHGA